MIPVIVLSNRGPKYLPQCIESIEKYLVGIADILVLRDYEHVGYTKMMQKVVEVGRALNSDVLFVEEDWTFVRDVDASDLSEQLHADATLAQVRVSRAPYFPIERRKGVAGAWWPSGWTCNPSLVRREIFTAYDWPDQQWSEQAFGELLTSNGHRFGIYGDEREPLVEHIGVERVETSHGY